MKTKEMLENIAESLLFSTINEGAILYNFKYRKNKNYEDVRKAMALSRNSKQKYNHEDSKNILIFELKNILKRKFY